MSGLTAHVRTRSGSLRPGALRTLLAGWKRRKETGLLLVRGAGRFAVISVVEGCLERALCSWMVGPLLGSHAQSLLGELLMWRSGRYLFRPDGVDAHIAAPPPPRPTDPGDDTRLRIGQAMLLQARLAADRGEWTAAQRLCEEAWDSGLEDPELYAVLAYAKFMGSNRSVQDAEASYALLDHARRRAPNLDIVERFSASIAHEVRRTPPAAHLGTSTRA